MSILDDPTKLLYFILFSGIGLAIGKFVNDRKIDNYGTAQAKYLSNNIKNYAKANAAIANFL